jgi:hypothetical protein
MEKAKNKQPSVKPYTLKDYRQFKKDAMQDTHSSTGKLGFDYASDDYKKKVGTFLFSNIKNKIKLIGLYCPNF